MSNTETKPESKNQEKLSLGAEELKQILTTVIQESKKPTELELAEHKRLTAERNAAEEKAAKKIQDEQDSRKQAAAAQYAMLMNKQNFKHNCPHETSGRVPHPQGTFVHDELGGYMLCSNCAGVFRPESHRALYPADYTGEVIFDNATFNQMYHKSAQRGMF